MFWYLLFSHPGTHFLAEHTALRLKTRPPSTPCEDRALPRVDQASQEKRALSLLLFIDPRDEGVIQRERRPGGVPGSLGGHSGPAKNYTRPHRRQRQTLNLGPNMAFQKRVLYSSPQANVFSHLKQQSLFASAPGQPRQELVPGVG